MLKRYWAVVLVLIGVMAIGYVGYGCGAKSRNNEVADLTLKIAQSEKTVQVKDGLYATTIVQMDGLKRLLDTTSAEVLALKKQLDKSQSQLLATQELVIKWKKAYEGALNATQTQPEPGRDRVDFTRDFGPIGVTGYTLTNPPAGFISIKQLRPLKLTVAVVRNKDATWSSLVTSSEPDMQVDVTLAGVDPGVIAPTWRQRIWLDMGADVLGDKRVSAGLSYHFDRMSLGVSCSAGIGNGCGMTFGYRLFK